MILCCGNPDRGDDGAGPRVAELLAGSGAPVKAVDGNAVTILDAWSGAPWVILVDAVVTGSPPGTIHVWDALPPVVSSPGSTHGFGVREAIELGRILDNLPPRCLVIGVEAGGFELGAPLSAEVEAALPQVVEVVLERFECLRRTDSGSGWGARFKESDSGRSFTT